MTNPETVMMVPDAKVAARVGDRVRAIDFRSEYAGRSTGAKWFTWVGEA